jgi:hypothetical protein
MAGRLGYRPTNYRSSGQRVFTNGKTFITQDLDFRQLRDLDGWVHAAWAQAVVTARISSLVA